ncbi:RRP12-like protein [Electrophorus electricus]|uniref:Ribosomal RNA-processing protein 12-like conserved domain-containing protein n=1 Tax=Electrophorus electricus TaxID=8005 RepID=A0A4W4E1K5_ELEEL|nr:RRP12-like protein [Electrophorus electricus]
MVKSGRLRSGSAQKLKRWKKGHSSDSNPQTSRYRQAARSRFFSRPKEKSDLTIDALKLHNELQTGSLERGAKRTEDAMDEVALTERTSGTFLSGLSDCSNLTFRKVQRYWESNSAAHKEICAVLAAVTEVIRSQGGKETETEYFAALMTTLEAVDSSESLAAVAYLLNLVMKRVPAPVLMKKFSDTAKSFMDVMSKQASADTVSSLRWILSCLAILLRKQELSVWSYPSTLQVYHGLLSFTVHAKPKVRKAAQQGVCSILRGSDCMFAGNAPSHHPAAVTTAKYCIKEMEQAGGSKEDTTTLHVLGLVRELITAFPLSSVKSCCETLLRVMTLSHVLVTAGAMQAFHKLFSGKPNPLAMSPELNAQIIMALYDYVPSENDLQPLLAWLAVMEKAHVHLYSLQSSLSLAHLPRLFSTAMSCLLSPHTQVVSAATHMLKTLINECVAAHMAEIGPVLPTTTSGNGLHIVKMFRVVEEGLSYRFHASWPFVLQILCCFYRAAGKHAHHVMTKSLQSLSDLRATPRFPFCGELDLAVGGAVESMGPQVVLGAVPLLITGIDDDLEFPRSWLIPVIRGHVKNTQLAYFISYFLPLASTLKQKADVLDQSGQKLVSKVYQTLELQIWTMLPGFCTNPTDLRSSFKGIARSLGMAITERPDLRLCIYQALRTIIYKSCETEEEKAEVGHFAKNFLPILFNVHTEQPKLGENDPSRLAVLDTIRAYLAITDQRMVNSFLQKALDKLSSPDSSEFTRLAVMDLVVVMASFVDEETMTHTYELIHSHLESKDSGIQKKAYRVLEEMCGGGAAPCKRFVLTNLEQLKLALLGSLKSASSPAKRPRLKCLIHIVKQLNEEHKDFLTALLPEVIVCTKEMSVGARKNAYSLLVEIGNAFNRFSGNHKDAMNEFLGHVYVGLTGSVTMITCTVLALTRLVFQFKDSIDVSALELLLHNVCLLLGCRTREIVKASLAFIKVLLFALDVKALASHVAVIMEGIGSMKDDMRRHCRTKLKTMFTKLIRKFGFELVKSMLPAEHHKVLANIRKAEARTKRHKLVSKAEEESLDSEEDTPRVATDSIESVLAETDSEDSEDEKPKKGQKKAAKMKAKAWLKEGTSDEPLNFLDPKAAQRVLATNPDVKKSANIEHGFKVTSDGRLIIKEAEEGDGAEDADKEIDDILKEAGIKTKKTQKRTIEDDLDDDMEIEPQMKYKAGGIGIHRPLSGRDESGVNYKSKKGKGDIKKKGKCDPYAYIPLKKAQLNRRKKAKLQGQFKGMVRGAKKGVLSGKRIQKRQRKT